jgi:hypothetical protein
VGFFTFLAIFPKNSVFLGPWLKRGLRIVLIRKKKSADADEKNKKVKENAENGFFSK